MDPKLVKRAEAQGLQLSYTDAEGNTQHASREAVVAVLDALGQPSSRKRRGEPVRPPVIVEWDGKREYGYHERNGQLIISAPRRMFVPGDPGDKTWGVFLPLYALGDFTDLRKLTEWVSEEGGALVGTLPLLASFLDEPFAPSPYTPCSRLFWNELYLDFEQIPEWRACTAARALYESHAVQAELHELRAAPTIDYRRQAAVQRSILEILTEFFFKKPSPGRTSFEAYLKENPELEDYAKFRAGHPGNQRARDYHAYVQWNTHLQLSALDRSSLYLDLPIGVHPDGYDVHREGVGFCKGLSVGAPPDPLFRGGQDWGFPPLNPRIAEDRGHQYFIDVVRNHLRYAGVLRLDHVMGLHRLYCVPDGMSATDGVYLNGSPEAMYAILSVESHRSQTLLIGEDLGTVPDAVRTSMQRHGVRRMHVQQFAIDSDPKASLGAAIPGSLSCMNTHDMPTFAGWWAGADIDDMVDLELLTEESAEAERAGRAAQKRGLSLYLRANGLLQGSANAAGCLRGCLHALAASDASIALVNLEDLWGETKPQNVPGTTMEVRPNWVRRAKYPLDVFQNMPSVVETLREVDRLRKGGALPNPTRQLPEVQSLLTDDDIYLFNEGTHYRLYDKLGAHITDGGATFAVWAPDAASVSVVGEFNGWDGAKNPMRARASSGIWECFVAGAGPGTLYKYRVTSRYGGQPVDKADPVGFFHEEPPKTASVLWDLDYEWGDGEWMKSRPAQRAHDGPISIYEMHLGSWKEGLDYRALAPKLAAYLERLGFTHVEFLPVMEHPFYGSWGYQTTGYFAPTSRYGTPQDFMYLVDVLHQRGIGVIVDWVPSHFPNDEHGLARFDGTHLFEHADPRKGFHPDWKSCIFNYGRNELRSFLISSACMWLDKYHIDGIRVDAVASMLYLDYSRKEGEWIPNDYGGRENLEAIRFLRELNEEVYRSFPGVQTYAEESTAWPMVSRPTYLGGLGFGFKWDMGWMHDTLEYMKLDPVHRKFHHGDLTFRMVYAFNENFVLALSHDEVVHGKGSLFRRMPGDDWQRHANLRLLYGYMYGQPGKKLLFMGAELGQVAEWSHESNLEWGLEEVASHRGDQDWLAALNRLYKEEGSLHERDVDPSGFEWIHLHGAEESVVCFARRGHADHSWMVCGFNFTPVVRHDYRIGAPRAGTWREVANSDAAEFGGSGVNNKGPLATADIPAHGRPQSLSVTLPPLGAIFLKCVIEPA